MHWSVQWTVTASDVASGILVHIRAFMATVLEQADKVPVVSMFAQLAL